MPDHTLIARAKTFFRSRRGALIGLWLAYFFYWGSLGPFVPFLSLFYESAGLTGTQIGQLSFTRSIVSFFSAVILAFLSDLLRRRRRLLTICIAGMIAALLVFSRMSTFYTLLPIVALYSVFLAPVISILDEDTLRALENPRDYGTVRMGGSFGWGILTFLTGLVIGLPGLSQRVIFTLHIALLAPLLVLVQFLPDTGRTSASGAEKEKASLADVWQLLRQPGYALWMGIIFVIGIGGAGVMNFLALHVRSLGGNSLLTGAALTCNILGEIAGFAAAKRLQGRVGSRRMMILSFFLRVFWFSGLAFIRQPLWILPVQLLGGASFALVQAGSVAYVNERAPRRIGTTAQAIRSAILIRLSAAFGALLSGSLYQSRGSGYMFAVIALINLVTFILALALRTYEHRRASRCTEPV
jgi:PPP family 3-phenylpropionic acid transporter